MRLRGTFTALISPFHEDGSLDSESFRLLVQKQLEAGISGLVVNGSTGESPTLEPEEAESLVMVALEETKGSIPLIVGTGSASTRHAIEATRRARALGADIALVVVPYYNKPSDEGLYLHFKSVADEGGLPVIVYNISGRTARNLETPVLERLAALPGIVGVKEGSGNLAQVTDVIDRIGRRREGFAVLSGDDAMAFPLLALGGDGLIATASNLLPEGVIELVDAALDGDMEGARIRHFGLLPLFRALALETNPAPIKAAMAMAGLPAGPCRPPLAPLSEENRLALRRALGAVGAA
jgi:4-hydroxy-tetrahydrodipicolinate synthase